MAKTQLIRKSFNAGELSPELHYRDDLAAYVKGCKKLTNMIPTPYGAVTRRPPFEVLSKIDHALYGVPVRYIPFKFSLTEVFHIVFTDGSGSESTDPTTADLIIFDEFGTQVIFDGNAAPFSKLPLTLDGTTLSGAGTLSTQGIVAMATTIYDPTDLHKIHFINVNDFVYLTCGGKYPVQTINRFFDLVEGGNRWKVSPAEVNGLIEDQNFDSESSVTAFVTPWEGANAAYSANTPVSSSTTNSVSITSVSFGAGNYVKNDGRGGDGNYHYIKFVLADASSFSVGDNIAINSVNVSSLGFKAYWPVSPSWAGTLIQSGDKVSGVWSISAILGNTITINIPVYIKRNGSFPTFSTGSVSSSLVSSGQPFYTSIQDVPANSNILLSNAAYWEGSDIFSGGLLELSSSQDIFKSTDVGRTFAIQTSSSLSGDWDSPDVSQSVVAQGVFELITEGGRWSGRLELQQSTDGGATWVKIKEIVSVNKSHNGSVEVEVTELGSILRVYSSDLSASTVDANDGCFWRLTPKNTNFQYFVINTFNDSRSVIATTVNPLVAFTTDHRWAFGVFSETTGFPYSLTIHDERMVYGGCQKSPNTVYASRVNDWGNFLQGNTETSPYTFTVASDSFNTIRSLKSSRQLNILTDNAENTMGSRDDNAITSITNISVSSHTNYGSNETQAIQLADMIWFVMGQGERVRASKYDFASDGQQSIEMSLFASHITDSGIKEMSFRRHPFNSLFCLLNNGTGAVLTYEGMQEVRAWATVKTEGNIISAASNYSDTGDIIAGVVKRNGSYFLEQFGSVDAGTVFLDNQSTWTNANFDIGQPIEQDDDGKLVVILDDVELTRDVDYTIAGGVLTIPSQLTGDVCIGRRIECRVNPTDISEVAPSGMVKRLTELGLYLLDSGTCNVAINGKPSPFTDGLKWVAGQRESGLFELTTGGDYEQGLDVNITIDSHRHFTLTGLGYRLGISQG